MSVPATDAGAAVAPAAMAALAGSVAGSLLPEHTGTAYGWHMVSADTVHSQGEVVAVAFPYAMATAIGVGQKHHCAVCLVRASASACKHTHTHTHTHTHHISRRQPRP